MSNTSPAGPAPEDLAEVQWPTRDGMRPARGISQPRDDFSWTTDPARQGQQFGRLYLLVDGRPAGHAVAVQARWICACGADGTWQHNQIAVSSGAANHRCHHPDPSPSAAGGHP